MTFPKWKSYSYKPLEPRGAKRRMRDSVGSPEPAAALSLSLSGGEDGKRSQSPVENGAAAHSRPTPPPPQTEGLSAGELTSTQQHGEEGAVMAAATQGGRRLRSFSVPSWTAWRGRLSLRRRPSGTYRLPSSRSPSPQQREDPASSEAVDEDEEGESDGGLSVQLEKTEEELEAVLREAWGSILTAGDPSVNGGFLRRKQALDYSRKMAGLRHQYLLKLAEIQQREATFARSFLSHDEATPLLLADQLSAPVELQRAIRDTQSSGRFDKLRLELKRDTAASVVALQSRYPSLTVRLRESGKREKLQRPRSCNWPVSSSVIYCNPHTDSVQQSGSMVGIFNGLYATENSSDHGTLYLTSSKILEETKCH